MNVEIGTETRYSFSGNILFRNFGILSLQCGHLTVHHLWNLPGKLSHVCTLAAQSLRPFLKILHSVINSNQSKQNIAQYCRLFSGMTSGDLKFFNKATLLVYYPLWKFSEAIFRVHDYGDKVDSGIGLSYRPARLHRLAGRYSNPMPETQLYPPVRD